MQLPRSLELALSERKVIPFIGAGLSRGVADRDGEPLFPSWSELLFQAARALEGEGLSKEARLVESLVEAEDLLEAAKRAQTALGQARWLRFLKTEFDKTYDEADPASLSVLRLVWTIGSNLVITTNYDRSLQWTCPDRADFLAWDIEAKAEQVSVNHITPAATGDSSRPVHAQQCSVRGRSRMDCRSKRKGR